VSWDDFLLFTLKHFEHLVALLLFVLASICISARLAFDHSTNQVDMIPEFRSILTLPISLMATLLAVMVYRRKRWPLSNTFLMILFLVNGNYTSFEARLIDLVNTVFKQIPDL